MPRHLKLPSNDQPKRPFACSHCCTAFTTRPFLRRHLNDVHGRREPLACRHCGKTFAAASYLADHIIRLHKGNISSNRWNLTLRCSQCSAVFKTRHGIICHLAYRHSANCKSVRCHFCPLTFVYESDMNTHRKMVHLNDPEDRIKCKLCPLSFNSLAVLRRHQLQQHATSREGNPHVRNKQQFVCARCAKLFKTNLDLSDHINKNLCEIKVLRYPCKECRASFISRVGLTYHCFSRHNSTPLVKPFKCETCPSAFMTEARLKHHRPIHNTEKRFVCEICTASFNCRTYLASHRHRVHRRGVTARQFFCAQCSRPASRRYLLHHHLRSVHSAERPFRCTECTLSFKDRDAIIAHVNAHHPSLHQGFVVCARCTLSVACKRSLTTHLFDNKRPCVRARRSDEGTFRCATCLASFKIRGNAQKHILSHSLARNIVCPLCGHRVKHKQSLKYHFLSQHAGSQHEFKCSECASSFITKALLKLHQISHTNERLYICSLCPSAFKHLENLRRHEKLHSEKAAFKCGRCFTYYKTRHGLRVHNAAVHTVAVKNKSFACAICVCRYTTKWAIENHIRKIHLCGKPRLRRGYLRRRAAE